jgi:hypothetical protein
MGTTSIVVNSSTARNITVDPTRVYFKANLGVQTLCWLPAGATEITDIQFDSAEAPISNLQGPGPGGQWTADWTTATSSGEAKTWKYTIKLRVDGEPLPDLDPEIENGAPPGSGS